MSTSKITILSPSEFPGTTGDSTNFIEIINQFLTDGFRVLLICPKSRSSEKFSFDNKTHQLEVVRINSIPPRLNEIKNGIKVIDYINLIWFLLLETATVLKLIQSNKIRKLYLRHSLLTMHLSILFKLLRIETVADGEMISESVDILRNPIIKRILFKFELLMLKGYTYFKVSNEAQKRSLIEIGLNRESIVIVPISVNIDKIPKYDIDDIQSNTFGYFGGLEPWQGIEFMIESFKLLQKRIPSALLYIIGDGSMMQKLRESTISNDLEKNIIFVGKVSREELWYTYFKKFRISIIPRQSLSKSIDCILPIKVIESLAASKPAIAFQIPAMNEIHDKPLLLVPSGNQQAFSDAMYFLTTLPDELKKRSTMARKSSEFYDIKRNIKILSELLAY